MRQVKFISGEKIYLRPVEESDFELVLFGKNDIRVRETLFLNKPVNSEEIKNELKKLLLSKETIMFTICTLDGDIPVGQTGLFRVDHVSRAAVFYIAIYDPDYWSKGFGTEATKLLIEYSFDILNLNRIQLHVSTENKYAVEAYKKSGYTIEGILRQAMYHSNKYVDFYVMSILREEYYDSSNAPTSHN